VSQPSPRFAIVLSRFNEEVTSGLLRGARAYLGEKDVAFRDEDLFHAPGAFEIPLLAQRLARLKRPDGCGPAFDGVICLGCVIKGDTAHFEFISLGATFGLMQAMLAAETPISFGILTTYTDAQAASRSADDAHNKGREAAGACLDAWRELRRISAGAPKGGPAG
jgi:6,7-dimethyl-8-ribityllumazine synthase